MRNSTFVIAEIGCNHTGNLLVAKDMIDIAATYCKVDAVKFQKRCNKELLTEEEYNAPHPVPYHSYGNTYGEHREKLEFTIDQHAELKQYCESKGVIYSTSVWDLTSAKEITAINPSFIKIPSACNLNFPMLDYLCENYRGKIHVSLGMTDQVEEGLIFRFFELRNRNKDLVIYACTSGYPVPFEDICLLEIKRLCKKFYQQVHEIGFSGHHLGIAIDPVAVALGAQIIERHFTLDRTQKGTDHSASLEPDGMRKLVRDINNITKALTYKKTQILPIEEAQRKKLKRMT